jgi:hypothetical protein
LSTSEPDKPVTDFDRWLADEFAQTGAFTSLVVLVSIAETKVLPLCSTYLNVIGTETDWGEIVVLFAGAGREWDGASFFPVTAPDGGPLDNPTPAHRPDEHRPAQSRGARRAVLLRRGRSGDGSSGRRAVHRDRRQIDA